MSDKITENDVMESLQITAILPAAGSGERMSIDIQKQLVLIRGKPLIWHAALAFLKHPSINNIIVVASENSKDFLEELLSQLPKVSSSFKKIFVTTGGPTRHRSIMRGIQYVLDHDIKTDIIVLHDGVRPIVPLETLSQVILTAHKYKAVGITRPLISTVISPTPEHFLDVSLERTKYFASEMPQAFNFDLLLKTYKKCSDYDLDYGTECLQLVLKYMDIKAKLIEGPVELWKVTHKKDLYAAEGLLAESETVGIFQCLCPELLKFLEKDLSRRFIQVKCLQSYEAECENVIHFHDGVLLDILDNLTTQLRRVSVREVHVIFHPEKTLSKNGVCSLAEAIKTSQLLNLKFSKMKSLFFICFLNKCQKNLSKELQQKLSDLTETFFLNDNLSGQILFL